MALSKDTARMIVEVVAADAECQSAIHPLGKLEVLYGGAAIVGEFTGLAGSVRNVPLVLRSMFLNKDFDKDAAATKLLCIGITTATIKPLVKAIRDKKLPGVHTANAISRVHWGTDHTATWIRMEDDSEYAFDWHATLQIKDPMISKAEDWMQARNATNFVLFSGFN